MVAIRKDPQAGICNPPRMNILLVGAAWMLIVSLVLAWVATFAKLIVWRPVAALIKDYGALIRAHIDLLLMALSCLALYAIRIPLPIVACWLVVIGGFTNPGLFLVRAINPVARPSLMRQVLRLASFSITTVGHGWIALAILRAV
jgi:ABC-type arginine transport system permease subunit